MTRDGVVGYESYDPGPPRRSKAVGQRPPRARLVWVFDPEEREGRWLGLAIEWRKQGDGRWLVRVIFAVDEATLPESFVIERWMPAEQTQLIDIRRWE